LWLRCSYVSQLLVAAVADMPWPADRGQLR